MATKTKIAKKPATTVKKFPPKAKAASKKAVVKEAYSKKPVAKKLAKKRTTVKAKTTAKKVTSDNGKKRVAINKIIPTKMNQGVVEPEESQDQLTEEEELLLSGQKKKIDQRGRDPRE
jgi:hypothetical protein